MTKSFNVRETKSRDPRHDMIQVNICSSSSAHHDFSRGVISSEDRVRSSYELHALREKEIGSHSLREQCPPENWDMAAEPA